MRTIVAIASILLLGAPVSRAADPLDAFPPAEKGMVRHVIRLPTTDDEDERKVELILGKTVTTDSVNRYFFAGALTTESISGWGFERFILPELGPMAGTMMAAPPDSLQVQRFVSLGGEPRLLRYNSRVPLVVYTPAGVEVRHRLWRAETTGHAVHKVALPNGDTAVVAEGDLETRSVGSYSVRRYAGPSPGADDGETFFKSGLVRPRDGSVEHVLIADLGSDGQPGLIVTIRSSGSGSFLSADAFAFEEDAIVLTASVKGLSADTDPVSALRSSRTSSKRQ